MLPAGWYTRYSGTFSYVCGVCFIWRWSFCREKVPREFWCSWFSSKRYTTLEKFNFSISSQHCCWLPTDKKECELLLFSHFCPPTTSAPTSFSRPKSVKSRLNPDQNSKKTRPNPDPIWPFSQTGYTKTRLIQTLGQFYRFRGTFP